MSSKKTTPLIQFEASNYPDGKRKQTRITIGGAVIGYILIAVATILNIPLAKISIMARLLKLIGE